MRNPASYHQEEGLEGRKSRENERKDKERKEGRETLRGLGEEETEKHNGISYE